MDKGFDELYQEAFNLVISEKNPSIGFIQRQLRIGYNRAASIIDRMEAERVVSAADHLGRREIIYKEEKLPEEIQEAIDENPYLGKYIRNEYKKQQKKIESEPELPVMKEADKTNNVVGGIAVDKLKSLIERVERLEEEKKAISSDVRDIFAEAKSAGFDVKIMRMILKLRKMNAADRDEEEFLLETYRKALDI